MPWKFWRRGLLDNIGHARRSPPRRHPRRYQPGFEILEARTTPTVFSNPTPIQLADGGPANPYPSNINVSGLNGTLQSLTVTLHRVTDDFADDIDVLLVSPQGQNLILIGDAGLGANDVVTIIFDDNGSLIGANDSGWANGVANTTVVRKPVNYNPADSFPAPAPNPPYTDPGATATGPAFLKATFGGINPNGRWQLYVVDDTAGSDLGGVIGGGWSLDITVLGSDLSITKDNQVTQAVPGETVTYTITVTNPGPFGVVGANVTDQFPAVLRGITYTATGTGGATGFTGAGAGDINDFVNMPPDSTITYTATGTIDPAAKEDQQAEMFGLLNIASITPPAGVVDPVPDNNFASDFDPFTPVADVTINMRGAGVGKRRLLYTVTVRNLGPSNADNVVLADLLPPNTLFLAQAQTAGPAFSLGNNGNQITNFIDVLPAGATARFAIVAAAPRGRVFNVAAVSSDTPDPRPGNNVSSVASLVGNRNRRWLAQVYRDVIKREIGAPALEQGEKFLSQPGNPRTLRLQYMHKLLSSLLYFARISHDAYNNILHEAAHQDDCVKSLNFLHNGGTGEQLSAMLFGDTEYFERRGGGTTAGWAAAVFQDIFGRPIDAAGAALIKDLLAKELSREAVAQNLLNTVEARVRLVRGWFQQFLQRDPTKVELTRLVRQLGQGVPEENIIATIVASPEYFQKV